MKNIKVEQSSSRFTNNLLKTKKPPTLDPCTIKISLNPSDFQNQHSLGTSTLKLTFSKRPSLLPLTPSTATRPSSSCQQPAPQDSNPQRPTARPSSWWQQWTAPMDNKYSQTSRRTPGAVGRRQPRFTSSQVWQKKEAENSVQRIYSQVKQQSRVSTSTHNKSPISVG